ncbi:MAG: 50S ribosomal protein L18 [Candidatus Vogelbacteria bacterium]|nr:50S ribosomal protein L18 [Candidatus Vogelbacteria bacterium]
MKTPNKNAKRIQRHHKVRVKAIGTAAKPRLCVFRSNKHIYGQLIDDLKGETLASADDSKIKADKKGDFAKVADAKAVGFDLAAKAKDLKIKKVVFDRGGYIFTGRVKALAEGAREGGLEF